MAVLPSPLITLLLVLSCCNFAFVAVSAPSRHARRPSVVFAFGDALADTGNGLRMFNPILTRSFVQPYGSTFFGQGVGRYSDGRVVIDCVVQSLGLSFLNPSFGSMSSNFSNGASYAAGMSATLDYTTLVALGFAGTNEYALEDQLESHLTFLQYAGTSMNTQFPTVSAISEGLYFIAVGGVDLISFVGSTTEVVRNVTQLILVKITEVVQVLYEHGARNFLLASTVPFGCVPAVKFAARDLDDSGCLATVNDIFRNYSILLAALSQSLSKTLPNASVAFLDIYSAMEEIFTHPDQYGFVDTLNACCAASTNVPTTAVVNGYSDTNPCGPMSTVCEDPSTFMNWDGEHYTDNTYRQAVNLFVEGKFIMPSDALSRFGAVAVGKA